MSLVLVTGGAGFIGSWVVSGLSKADYRVRVLDNLSPQVHGQLPKGLDWLSGVDFVRGSVTCREDLQRALAGANVVVHLAAETGTGQSMYEIARYSDVNIGGTAALLDVLANSKDHGVERLVLTSSRAVYGEGAYVCATCAPQSRVYPAARTAKQLAAHKWDHACPQCGATLTAVPTCEDDAARPASIYAATKLAQEHLTGITCAAHGIGYAILRLQNVYGEGQSLNNPYTGILSIFSTRLRRGSHLPIYEDGLETRDFVHVADVANAIVAAVRSDLPANGVVNVGSGVATTVSDVARALATAFGQAPDLVVTGEYRLGDIRHNCADISRMRALLGYEPAIGLAEGLRRFAAWVENAALAGRRARQGECRAKGQESDGMKTAIGRRYERNKRSSSLATATPVRLQKALDNREGNGETSVEFEIRWLLNKKEERTRGDLELSEAIEKVSKLALI